MTRTPFDQTFEALQKKWQCSKHGPGNSCYIDSTASGNDNHLRLQPRDWAIWATKIMEGQAIMDYPPRTREFEIILAIARAESRKGSRRSKKDDLSDSDRDGKPHFKIINYHPAAAYPDFGPHHHYSNFMRPSQYGRRHSDPSQSPRKSSSTKDIIQSLKDMGYSPREWVSRGLEDYFKWLDNQFEGMSFQKALENIQSHDIGLDSLGMEGVDVKFLASHCGISPGDALRILNNFKRWVDEKLVDQGDD